MDFFRFGPKKLQKLFFPQFFKWSRPTICAGKSPAPAPSNPSSKCTWWAHIWRTKSAKWPQSRRATRGRPSSTKPCTCELWGPGKICKMLGNIYEFGQVHMGQFWILANLTRKKIRQFLPKIELFRQLLAIFFWPDLVPLKFYRPFLLRLPVLANFFWKIFGLFFEIEKNFFK